MEKKKVIVYGLGNALKAQKYFIKTQFSIVGYSDTSYHSEEGYIKPEEIAGKEFDYIYVTSTRYFSEIRTKLVEECKISEDKIISLADVLGDFDNAEVRRKWIIQRLKEIPAGKLLLDAGAGEMQYKPYCDHLKYIAQDFGQYDPAKDWGGVSTPNKWDTSGVNIVCDIVDMPLESESVDVILCSEVFEHLQDPVLAIKEFSRIIKKDGKLILTAPFCSLTHMAPYFYCNGFSEYWYQSHLMEYEFDIEEIIPNGNYFKYLNQELFRVNEMAKRYCNVDLNEEEIKSLMDSIEILSKLSLRDKFSNEVLCFGYMVIAKKRV